MEILAGFMEQEQLLGCNGIFAVDVLGPSAWVSPKAYRYLASQTRHYLENSRLRVEARRLVGAEGRDRSRDFGGGVRRAREAGSCWAEPHAVRQPQRAARRDQRAEPREIRGCCCGARRNASRVARP